MCYDKFSYSISSNKEGSNCYGYTTFSHGWANYFPQTTCNSLSQMRNFLYLRTNVENFWELNLPIGFSPHNDIGIPKRFILKTYAQPCLMLLVVILKVKHYLNPVNISSSHLFTWSSLRLGTVASFITRFAPSSAPSTRNFCSNTLSCHLPAV